MAQIVIVDAGTGYIGDSGSLALKQPFTEQISRVDSYDDEVPIFSEEDGSAQRYGPYDPRDWLRLLERLMSTFNSKTHFNADNEVDELVAKAIQIQGEIEQLICEAREQESQRLASLSVSMRELEQNQTVALLLLGMLNRRVLYDYHQQEATIDDKDFGVRGLGIFNEEISLIRRTIADVALSEGKINQLIEGATPDVHDSREDISKVRSAFEEVASRADDGDGLPANNLTLRHIITQTKELFLASRNHARRAAELEKAQIRRLGELSEPLWDVCADIREMCDLLEFCDFALSKDEFLRRILLFACRVPRQWPQATNFRCEVRSDVRSNLGLDKYGELRWHHE